MHRADIHALSAADADGIVNETFLSAVICQQSRSVLHNGKIERDLRISHHRSARNDLERFFFESAASVEKRPVRRSYANQKIFRSCDVRAADGHNALHQRFLFRDRAVKAGAGIDIEHGKAVIRGQFSSGDLNI